MSKMTEALIECEELNNNIMSIISKQLEANDIKFTNNNQSEIIISDYDKDSIKNILSNIENVDNSSMKLLIQITEVNSKIFIRQKFD